MNSMKLLLSLIMQSPVLEQEDKQVIRLLEPLIDLRGVNIVKDVNTALKDQLDLEAYTSYLRGKYRGRKSALDYRKDKSWHEAGRKHGARSADRNLDVDFVELDYESMILNDLVSLLNDLATMVFSRQSKLEHLSVNYRREAFDDRGIA